MHMSGSQVHSLIFRGQLIKKNIKTALNFTGSGARKVYTYYKKKAGQIHYLTNNNMSHSLNAFFKAFKNC